MTAKDITPAKRIVRGLHNWQPEIGPCAVTIGNFDGMHKGHSATLSLLLGKAKELAIPAVVVVVETNDSEKMEEPVAPLMCFRDKIHRLLFSGVDRILLLKLAKAEAAKSFIRHLLTEEMNIRTLVSGDEIHLGRSTSCKFGLLESLSQSGDFSLVHSPDALHEQRRITANRVRRAVAENQFTLATELLGRAFTMQGRVIKDQQLGTQLGWPTANLSSKNENYPISGVFAVQVKLADGTNVEGVANIGARPTVGDLVRPLLEVHILNFNRNIYGQHLEVTPLYKIREEKKFSSLEELKSAIAEDIKKAKNYFAGEKQAGPHD